MHELRRGVSLFGHAEEAGGGEAKAGGDTLLLRVGFLHVLELVQTRAEDVVRHPAEHGHERTEDDDARVEASGLHELRRGVSLFGHAGERSGGEAEAEGHTLLTLGILHLHIIELVQSGSQNVVQDPTKRRSENHEKHKCAAVHAGNLGDFHGGGTRLLSSEGERAREGKGGGLWDRRAG